jgi:hypothetical protein
MKADEARSRNMKADELIRRYMKGDVREMKEDEGR